MGRMLLIILVLVASVATTAQEKAVLSTPIAQPTITEMEIAHVVLGRYPFWRMEIAIRDNTGRIRVIDEHTGEVSVENPNGADMLVKAINKANGNPAAGGKTIECRALEHLRDEGKIATVGCSGTPQ